MELEEIKKIIINKIEECKDEKLIRFIYELLHML